MALRAKAKRFARFQRPDPDPETPTRCGIDSFLHRYLVGGRTLSLDPYLVLGRPLPVGLYLVLGRPLPVGPYLVLGRPLPVRFSWASALRSPYSVLRRILSG